MQMPMRKLRFALFGNIYQPKKSVLVKKLLCSLEERKAEVYIDRKFYEYLTKQMLLDIQPTALIDDDFSADIAVSMGGDGTFLQTASRVADKGIPIIGINMGRMGFLADVSGDEIDSTIASIYADECRVEERSVLQVEFIRSEKRETSEQREQSGACIDFAESRMRKTEGQASESFPYALNEVAVLKRDNSSMISIRVDINGEYLTTYQADGLIINTPTGSTGYALSVGGPIMSPEAHTLGITPVAPHSLNVRPITLCDDAEVTLTVESRNHNFLVAIDGRSEACSEETRLHIRKAPYCIRVLKQPESSFYRTLRSKLMWGNDVRN